MAYRMRFIQTDDTPITLEVLNAGLQEEEPAYSLDANGRLCFSEEECAQVEVLRPGDGRFEADLSKLKEGVARAEGRNVKRVSQALEKARSIVSVEVLWQDGEPEVTLEKIDPLWRWLFSNRAGLVQADDEGYYERSRRILAVE